MNMFTQGRRGRKGSSTFPSKSPRMHITVKNVPTEGAMHNSLIEDRTSKGSGTDIHKLLEMPLVDKESEAT